ncbi:ELongator protein 2 90kD subunit [Scheffersomyces xylosifermentans]|uniref:ELongator protein 2 90kD subunit n=1 Tax=Scheffersomyces xylosifermentans TaxID=1304137 RepID=UPI00315CB75B
MVSSGVSQKAIFAGANKQAQVADYKNDQKVVAFGAGKNIALWNPLAKDRKGIYSTLKKHSKEITGIKFVPNSPFLVSVAEDTEINVWKEDENGEYSLAQTLNEHTSSITCLAVVNSRVFVTGSADGFVALWAFNENNGNNVVLVRKFEVKFNFLPTALAIEQIDSEGDYLLAIGGTSPNLFVYTFTLSSTNELQNFTLSASLTGHEDWIRCLQFVVEEKHKNYILASGSQDRYIRLWRLKLNDLIDDSDEDESKLILLSNKQYKFSIGESSRGAISFEALIMGHDDWVTGLQWHPSYKTNSTERKLQLLSSSADTALMVWEMDQESGIWVCVNRLGEMSIKGASTATGASGGFWSCLWFEDPETKTQYILANGKTGSFRVYRSVDEEAKTFEAVFGITGPVKEVTDLVWSRNGEYFTSTSLDQTSRLFAPWTENREYKTWHEFARPQIHGYDMICIDNITDSKYVSGGDEKVLRVFEITNSIGQLLKKLCNIEVASDTEQLPESASLPVLGLSNKAANEQLEAGEAAQQQQDAEENNEVTEAKEDVLATLTSPPLEDYLQRYTLFPEIEKLYGHGYELTCCATSPNGSLIASACKSNSAKHAIIRVFNARKEYQQSQQVLEGHNLTITSLEFSPDGKYLLAVSRDRQFSLWSVTDENEAKFELVELNTKAHSRIIWDCSWAPSNEFGQFFVTGSRDKQVKLWQVGSKVELVASSKLAEAVTSVSIYKAGLFDSKLILSIGLESGSISLFSVDLSKEERSIQHLTTFDDKITPSDRISKLSFSNKLHDGGKNLLLAVGSNDTSVRLYSIEKDSLV